MSRSAPKLTDAYWEQRAHVTNKLAAKKGHFEKVTALGLKAAWERSGGLCYWCKHKIQLGRRSSTMRLATVEHVKALSSGGSNSDNNIEFACSQCNWSRGRCNARSEKYSHSR